MKYECKYCKRPLKDRFDMCPICEPKLSSTCKTNTLDKCEKYRHDFIYHEVNGIIDQRLCRKCNLNEKLPEKNWNNEPCGNKLCENCHPEIYSKVKPEGVGGWINEFDYKFVRENPQGEKQDSWFLLDYITAKEMKEFITNFLLQEKAKWKQEIMRRISVADSLDYSDEKDVLNNLLDWVNEN